FFPTRTEGQAPRDALIENGISADRRRNLIRQPRDDDLTPLGPKFRTGAESEAGTDAWIGGAIGLAAGMIAVVLPGIGALIAAGPIAGAIGGLAAGTAAGGIVGLLKERGISEEEAQFYAEGVARGGALVVVHGVPDGRAGEARKILDK